MKKWDNFCASLKNLKEIYDYQEPYDNVILSGLVALYEICFEQAWKAMKEVLLAEGIEEGKTGSPRQVLKGAFQMGIIQDENIWLQALMSRNNVAHAYNHTIALDIVKDTKETYYYMFCSLKKELEENWI
ncbi:MAG: HI0074 family nucleotidyltransferase substrate-binding subunit [Lachnospiraceae bacterium]